MVVVAGVALILVGIGLARWSKAQSMMSTASTQLLLLSNALDHYADENGGYPHVADYSGLIVYVALFGDGVGSDGRAATEDDTELDGTPDKSATVYLKELDPMGNPLKMVEHSEQGIPARLVDPWGNRGATSAGPMRTTTAPLTCGRWGRMEGTEPRTMFAIGEGGPSRLSSSAKHLFTRLKISLRKANGAFLFLTFLAYLFSSLEG